MLRSILFFPGDRPDLLPKAVAAGPDAVCADLEDAVGPEGKEAARTAVAGLLREDLPTRGTLFTVRINGLGTGAGARGRGGSSGSAPGGAPESIPVGPDPALRDLEMLTAAPRFPDALLIPKVGGPEEAERAADLVEEYVPGADLVLMIETARGLAAVEEIATACRHTRALAFGGIDLGGELGADGSWESLLYARSRLVHAAALAGVAALDMPWMAFRDEEGLREEASGARRLGFTGKLAVHPRQVAPIHETFAPTAEEVERAKRILAAFEEAGGGAMAVEGRVVDRPVVEAARRVLAFASPSGRAGGST